VEGVEHARRNPQYQLDPFSAVEVRYDRSGNPVIERRLHQGGFTRVRYYDYAGRLTGALDGHVINLGGALCRLYPREAANEIF
jgi:hypothetical protein